MSDGEQEQNMQEATLTRAGWQIADLLLHLQLIEAREEARPLLASKRILVSGNRLLWPDVMLKSGDTVSIGDGRIVTIRLVTKLFGSSRTQK